MEACEVVDNKPMQIQPRMQKLVEALRLAGFETTDSGDGVTNVAAGMDDALSFPHVFMTVATKDMEQEAKRLLAFAEARSKSSAKPRVEATYSPADGICVLALYEITDDDLMPKTVGQVVYETLHREELSKPSVFVGHRWESMSQKTRDEWEAAGAAALESQRS